MIYIFPIAIVVSYVVRWFCAVILHGMLESGKTHEELFRMFSFNALLVNYIISNVILWVSLAITAAWAVKSIFL